MLAFYRPIGGGGGGRNFFFRIKPTYKPFILNLSFFNCLNDYSIPLSIRNITLYCSWSIKLYYPVQYSMVVHTIQRYLIILTPVMDEVMWWMTGDLSLLSSFLVSKTPCSPATSHSQSVVFAEWRRPNGSRDTRKSPTTGHSKKNICVINMS